MDEETSGSGNEEEASTRFTDERAGLPIGDFGLRKRRVTSKEQLVFAESSSGMKVAQSLSIAQNTSTGY